MRELWNVTSAIAMRRKDDYERDTIQAWNVERIHVKTRNDKRMPDLHTFLTGKAKKQTPEDHERALRFLSEQHGIKLRIVQRPTA